MCDNQLSSRTVGVVKLNFYHILDDSVSLFFPSSVNQWAAPGRRWRTMWGTRDIRWSDSSPTLFIFLLSEPSTLMAWATPARSQSRSGRRVSDMRVIKMPFKIHINGNYDHIFRVFAAASFVVHSSVVAPADQAQWIRQGHLNFQQNLWKPSFVMP